jgi:hypothetical protein
MLPGKLLGTWNSAADSKILPETPGGVRVTHRTPSNVVVAEVALGSMVMTASGTLTVKLALVIVCCDTVIVTRRDPRPGMVKTLLNQIKLFCAIVLLLKLDEIELGTGQPCAIVSRCAHCRYVHKSPIASTAARIRPGRIQRSVAAGSRGDDWQPRGAASLAATSQSTGCGPSHRQVTPMVTNRLTYRLSAALTNPKKSLSHDTAGPRNGCWIHGSLSFPPR